MSRRFIRRFSPPVFLVCWVLAIVLSAICNPLLAQDAPASSGAASFVPGQVLIQYRAGATPAQENEARGRVGVRAIETIRGGNGRGRLELASLPPGQEVAAAVRSLKAHSAVAFAEPNWIYTHSSTSNDPYYTNSSLWGMYGDQTVPANQFGSQAGEAWGGGQTGSKSVVVGVIDEGIDYNHPDLKPNVGNPKETLDGLDNDGNGKIDDVYGWDFVNNDKTVYDGGNLDKHGTHVAGTIGAAGGNGAGVVGINWQVSIISGKFLGSNGGTTANAVKAVDYFTDLKSRGVNIVATNNSWGGGGYSQALHDAILRGAKAGILFVAAAGNDGTNNDTTIRYPSSYDTTKGTTTESAAGFDAVIAVAAIGSNGAKPSWSNYGKTTVDLAAPGSGIYSTLPANTYGSYSGTSMATPHVSSAVALYAASGVTGASAIKSAILQSAKNTPTTSVASTTVTGGRLNLSNVVPPTYGSLAGTVTQAANGAPLSGATITVGSTLTATTDTEGNYSIENVPTGTYSVSAAAAGYDSQTTTGVAVKADTQTTTNFALETHTEIPMFVQNITWTRIKKGSTYDLQIVVTVGQDADRDGQPETSDARAANASVTLKLDLGGSSLGTATATTNSQGQVTFKVSKAKRGNYLATVTALNHNTYIWDQAMDLNNPSFFTF